MRNWYLWLLGTILVSVGSLSNAQGLCGGLDEEDCAVLTQAQDNMAELTAAAVNANINLIYENIPNTASPLTANITATAAFQGNIGDIDLPTQMTNSHEAGGYLLTALEDVNADLNLQISAPPELVQLTTSPLPAEFSLRLRLVDEIGYVNFDDLQPVLSTYFPMLDLMGWVGINLEQLIAQMTPATQAADAVFVRFDEFDLLLTIARALHDPQLFQAYATIERSNSAFTTSYDLAGMFADPTFHNLVRRQLEARSGALTDEQVQSIVAPLPIIGEHLEITTTHTVDEAYITQMGLDVRFDYTPFIPTQMVTTGQITGPDGVTVTQEPVVVTLEPQPAPIMTVQLTLNFTDRDAVPEIQAPENAQLVPQLPMQLIRPQPTPIPETGSG